MGRRNLYSSREQLYAKQPSCTSSAKLIFSSSPSNSLMAMTESAIISQGTQLSFSWTGTWTIKVSPLLTENQKPKDLGLQWAWKLKGSANFRWSELSWTKIRQSRFRQGGKVRQFASDLHAIFSLIFHSFQNIMHLLLKNIYNYFISTLAIKIFPQNIQ